jgi:hypothetical protein
MDDGVEHSMAPAKGKLGILFAGMGAAAQKSA